VEVNRIGNFLTIYTRGKLSPLLNAVSSGYINT